MGLLVALVTVLLVTTLVESQIIRHNMSMLSDEMIDSINSINTTWTAGRNFDRNTPKQHIIGLMGVKHNRKDRPFVVLKMYYKNNDTYFDAREKWPYCSSISRIRDQGSCGSSWALAVADSISDRLCIHFGGTQQVEISAEELLSCCADCGYGCGGGYVTNAWEYYFVHGLVTGSSWNSTKGCKPYTIPACEHHTTGKSGSCGDTQSAPVCSKECQKGFKETYQADKHFGSQSETRTFRNRVPETMHEILKRGPVQAQLTVYADFLHYKSGVYRRHSDKFLGVQAIRILGWGEENGHPYWLCANSWGTKWGDNGYFKILRYHDECGIERRVTAVIPNEPSLLPKITITAEVPNEPLLEPKRTTKKTKTFLCWLEDLFRHNPEDSYGIWSGAICRV